MSSHSGRPIEDVIRHHPIPPRRTRRRAVAVIALSVAALGSVMTLAPTSGPLAVAPASAAVARPTAPVGGSGAAALGTTSHPVPSGAVWVSPQGSDNAAGTKSAPVRTVSRAVRIVPSGGTVVLRAGVYRESVDLPYRKPMTIQNADNEVAWLDGSRIETAWTPTNGDWRLDGFTPEFDTTPEPDALSSSAPLAAHPEMVLVDGQQLRQVATRGEVVPGTFMVDRGADRIYLGTDPNGRQVAVAWLERALFLNLADDVTLRGFGVRRYATPVLEQGAVQVVGNRAHVSDLVIEDIATTGLHLFGDDIDVDRVTVSRSGMLGVSAYKVIRLNISDSLIQDNNREDFRSTPEAGGFKTTRSRGVTVEQSTFRRNRATGLWTDIAADEILIARNLFEDQGRHGIEIELGGDALVAGNVVVRSGGTGIYINESARSYVWNNTLVDNEWAWQVVDGPRTQDSTDAPGTTEIAVIRNNLAFGSRPESKSIIQANDYTYKRTGTAMGAEPSDNAYYPPAAGKGPSKFAIWGNYPGHPLVPATLAELQSSTTAERRSFSYPGVDPFVDSARGDYRLKAGAAAVSSGASLPGSVAAALLIPRDSTVDRGALLGDAAGPPPPTTAKPPATTAKPPVTTAPPPPPTTTPVPTAGERFVRSAYVDFLGRLPSSAEMTNWRNKVGTADQRSVLLRSLAYSDEWIGTVVDGYYRVALGRNADATGRAYWVRIIRDHVMTPAQVAAYFYASEEYFARRGSRNDWWVTDLYRELLLREPDPVGQKYWTRIAGSDGREKVAAAFYDSPESLNIRVNAPLPSLPRTQRGQRWSPVLELGVARDRPRRRARTLARLLRGVPPTNGQSLSGLVRPAFHRHPAARRTRRR